MRFTWFFVCGCALASVAQGQMFAQRVATGLDEVIYATHAPGDTQRLFLCQKPGVIRILDLTTLTLRTTPFLTIADTDDFGDGGLQSIAFHPDYADNGLFYVHVTVDNGGAGGSPFSVHIREYGVSSDPDIANPGPREIMRWVKFQHNHNGGWIGFNPKRTVGDPQYLYISSGDGGSQQDPENDAQTLTNNRLGKMFRIDVSGDDFPADPLNNFAIPPDNPFVGASGDDEIWSYGLRNPWRCGFDRATGDLYIGDVGQAAREEIDRDPAGSAGGANYAWNRREGLLAHNGGALLPGDTQPIYDYGRTGLFGGGSVVGGYVYRGPLAELRGQYIFCDTISGNIWRFDPANPGGTVVRINPQLVPDAGTLSFIVSLGEDALGNIYFCAFGAGAVYRATKPCVLTGDIDDDGVVGIVDLAEQLSNFGENFLMTIADGNLDGDTDVDILDLSMLLSAFADTCP